MTASQPWRTPASTPILTGASPMIARRWSSFCSRNNSKHGHRNHARRNARSRQKLMRRRPRSRPPSRWRRARLPRGRRSQRSHRRHAHRGCRRRSVVAQLRQVLPRQASTLGPFFASSASCQHSAVSTASQGRKTSRFGNSAQRGEMLDRLVRRAVFAEADRVVRHHMDDALAHQRGEPDRRPAVIGEDQEGAGIRNDAAVQRHAVHGRGHAVLAHAVMDEAAGDSRRRSAPSCALARVLLEPVRSAEPPIISGSAGVRASSANSEADARRDFLRRGRELLFHSSDRGARAAWPAVAASCGARIRRAFRHRARRRAFPMRMRAFAARAGRAPAL